MQQVVQKFGWGAFVAAGYFLSAILALTISSGPDNTATIWAPSGIVMAALILGPRQAYAQILVAAALASMGANFYVGTPWWETIGYTVANVLEAVVGIALLRVMVRGRLSFDRPAFVGRFAIIAVISAATSTGAAVVLSANYGSDFRNSWFMTVVLGQLISTPLIVTMYRQAKSFTRDQHRRQYAEIAAIGVLVMVTSLCVFSQSKLPLLFVPVLPVLLATYRLGPIGAALGVSIVTAIGSIAAMRGIGPTALMTDHSVSDVTFLQIYLVALLVSALPLAASLAARNQSYEELERQKAYFEMVSQTLGIGHWRLVLEAEQLAWSDQVFRIHGLPPGGRPLLTDALNAYHPEDRATVSNCLEGCIANGEEFAFDARIVTVQGDIRHVNSRGRAERDEKGRVVGVFGVIQDVTERVVASQELDEARERAVQKAKQAQLLAETDQLTGVANRRKAMDQLDRAVAAAKADQSDLVVAVLDIDHFKAVNDRFGHATGDAVLKDFAEICSGCLRSTDTFGRIGGEEFIVILPGASLDAAKSVAERIREQVMAVSADRRGFPAITTSIGLAAMAPGMGASALLQAADGALYSAKRGGRNILKVA